MNTLTLSKLVLSQLRGLGQRRKLQAPKPLDEQDMLRVRRSILRKLSRRFGQDDCQLA